MSSNFCFDVDIITRRLTQCPVDIGDVTLEMCRQVLLLGRESARGGAEDWSIARIGRVVWKKCREFVLLLASWGLSFCLKGKTDCM